MIVKCEIILPMTYRLLLSYYYYWIIQWIIITRYVYAKHYWIFMIFA